VTPADWALVGILGLGMATFAGIGALTGYLVGVRQKADVTADAIAAALPALAQRIEIAFAVQRISVPVHVAVRAEVADMAPVMIPITTLPAPTNLELARRIVRRVPDIGTRPLADILDIAPSTADAIMDKLRAEAAAEAGA
jgi:hypothetical protein